jgi:hypothetical protein
MLLIKDLKVTKFKDKILNVKQLKLIYLQNKILICSLIR